MMAQDEAGDVVKSVATYLCFDQNKAAPFTNCGQQTLENIATPVEILSCGRLNGSSKGMPWELGSLHRWTRLPGLFRQMGYPKAGVDEAK